MNEKLENFLSKCNCVTPSYTELTQGFMLDDNDIQTLLDNDIMFYDADIDAFIVTGCYPITF